MTDLAGTQITSLMETLPGIAQVLRSPVADAFVNVIRAATGQGTFDPADAEEIMRYAVRRNLMSADESERVLAEARAAAAAKPAVKRATKPVAKPAPRPVAAKKPPKKAVRVKPVRATARKSRPSPPRKTTRKAAKPSRKK